MSYAIKQIPEDFIVEEITADNEVCEATEFSRGCKKTQTDISQLENSPKKEFLK